MHDDILDYFAEDEHYKGKIIAIKYFYFESQARLYAARLEEAGIRTFVSNANTITAFPMGNGGIGLHIREADRDGALEIIAQLDQNNLKDQDDFSYHDADKEDIEYQKTVTQKEKRKINPVLALVLIILFLFMLRAIIRGFSPLPWQDAI